MQASIWVGIAAWILGPCTFGVLGVALGGLSVALAAVGIHNAQRACAVIATGIAGAIIGGIALVGSLAFWMMEIGGALFDELPA